MLFIIDLMIPHNGMNSIKVSIQVQCATGRYTIYSVALTNSAGGIAHLTHFHLYSVGQCPVSEVCPMYETFQESALLMLCH